MTDSNSPWGAQGQWYRGQLHCHTTGSDGRLAPQEAVARYAAQDYHFLAITDHNALTPTTELDAHGMCLIPSTEWTAPGGEWGTSYHLLAYGIETLPAGGTHCVEVAKFFGAQGAVLSVGHPHWSGLTVADVRALPGVHAVEIHNAATVLDSRKGEALSHWDELLQGGTRLWGTATDDMHWGSIDLGNSWVQVRAEACTPEALLQALKAGRFYASTGPELLEVRLEGLELHVRCSPCLVLYCLSFGPRNQYAANPETLAGRSREPISEASFHLRGDEGYVRVQVVDAAGRQAWSNPLFLGGR